MSVLFTSGQWTVLPGREEEFVAAWAELAEWTAREVPGSGWAQLIQREDDPRRFVSFGPWQSAEAIAAWRASAGFQERVARIGSLLEAFEPGVFTRRAGVDGPDPGR